MREETCFRFDMDQECFKGDACWFKHVVRDESVPEEIEEEEIKEVVSEEVKEEMIAEAETPEEIKPSEDKNENKSERIKENPFLEIKSLRTQLGSLEETVKKQASSLETILLKLGAVKIIQKY